MSYTNEKTVPFAIASGQSLSDPLDSQGLELLGILMPASWTAANLTFQGSPDGQSYADVYDRAGTEYTATAAASRLILLLPRDDLVPLRFLKVRSGTAGVPVAQAGGGRILTLLVLAKD